MTVAIRVQKQWASCALTRCLNRSATHDFQHQRHAGRQPVDDCQFIFCRKCHRGTVYQGEEFLGTYAVGIGDCDAVLQHHQNQLELLGWQVNEAESRSWGLVLVAEQNDDRRIVIQCNWG